MVRLDNREKEYELQRGVSRLPVASLCFCIAASLQEIPAAHTAAAVLFKLWFVLSRVESFLLRSSRVILLLPPCEAKCNAIWRSYRAFTL
jgi:hypothetical protein